jgi:hypothetical protein
VSIDQQANRSFCLTESADFLAKNWDRLQHDYGGKWVACAGRSVRLFSDDLVLAGTHRGHVPCGNTAG